MSRAQRKKQLFNVERVKYTLKRNWKIMSQVVVAVKHFLNICNWRWRSSPWRMRRNLGQEQHSSEMKKVTKMFKVITETWDTRQGRRHQEVTCQIRHLPEVAAWSLLRAPDNVMTWMQYWEGRQDKDCNHGEMHWFCQQDQRQEKFQWEMDIQSWLSAY